MENKSAHIAYGAITGIVMVITLLVIYLAGMAFVKGMQYIQYIPMLIGIILNAVAFSKANDGFVTFGRVFGNCFKCVIIITLILVVWSIASGAIFPEMKVKALEMIRTESAKNPQLTDEQIETSINMMQKNWNIIVSGGTLLFTLFFGAIFALVGGAVAQKKGDNPFRGEGTALN